MSNRPADQKNVCFPRCFARYIASSAPSNQAALSGNSDPCVIPALIVTAGIVDGFEVIHIKHDHIGVFIIDPGEKELISGTVQYTGQFIVGGFIIQVRQAAPEDTDLVLSAAHRKILPIYGRIMFITTAIRIPHSVPTRT